MEIEPRDTALLVKINHTQPIEVDDFVKTISAIGELFDGFCRNNMHSREAQKAKLYVNKIEQGSIEIFLTEAFSALALPMIENVNLIMDFAAHLKNVIEYFTEGRGQKPDLTAKELHQYHDIFTINANDREGSTMIGAVDISNTGGNVFSNCTFNFFGSNSAQNQITREEEEAKHADPTETVYHRKLLRIFQLRTNMQTDKGNRAIVDSLSDRPLALVFETDELKRRVLCDDNPVRYGYLVDVAVLTANDRPVAYKVMALHEVFPIDEDE